MRCFFLLALVCLCASAQLLQPLPEIGASDCLDCEELVTYKKSFPLETALANSSAFTAVRKAAVQKIIFSCENVYATKEESKAVWPPPSLNDLKKSDPEFILNLALRRSNVVIEDYYFNDAQEKANKGRGYTWTKEDIENRAQKPCTCGDYFQPQCEVALKKYAHLIKDAHGLVIGSQSPWAESALFRYGAARVTTIEYMSIQTSHPNHIALTPAQAATQFLAKTLQRPDFVFSFSSLEHDGLGRYGDPLNAFGDLESIAKVHCMLPINGLFFLGFPVGRDAVAFNAHRIYGFDRLSVILSMGFRLVDALYGKKFRLQADNGFSVQPVLVLQKIHASHHH